MNSGMLDALRLTCSLGRFTPIAGQENKYSGNVGEVGTGSFRMADVTVGSILYAAGSLYEITAVSLDGSGSIASLEVLFLVGGYEATTRAPSGTRGQVTLVTSVAGMILVTQTGSNFLTPEDLAKIITHNLLKLEQYLANNPGGGGTGTGEKGDGFTGGTYDPQTGQITFTSDDGIGFVTPDIRPQDGNNGKDGLGFTGGNYNPDTGQITITSDDGIGFTTPDLRPTGGTSTGGGTGGGSSQALLWASVEGGLVANAEQWMWSGVTSLELPVGFATVVQRFDLAFAQVATNVTVEILKNGQPTGERIGGGQDGQYFTTTANLTTVAGDRFSFRTITGSGGDRGIISVVLGSTVTGGSGDGGDGGTPGDNTGGGTGSAYAPIQKEYASRNELRSLTRYQWSQGDAEEGNTGLPIPNDCELVGMYLRTQEGLADINNPQILVERNGQETTFGIDDTGTGLQSAEFKGSLPLSAGDYIVPATRRGTGGTNMVLLLEMRKLITVAGGGSGTTATSIQVVERLDVTGDEVTVAALPADPSYLAVYRSGVRQFSTQYGVAAGKITLNGNDLQPLSELESWIIEFRE